MLLKSERCPGCLAEFSPSGTGIHAYIGASSGCWAVYTEVLAKEYENRSYWPAHRFSVDTYAVQHPGVPERRSQQSVNIHLMALYLLIEEDQNEQYVLRFMEKTLQKTKDFIWLDPPKNPQWLTVKDVVNAKNAEEHNQIVRLWSKSVWKAWNFHHSYVKQRVNELR